MVFRELGRRLHHFCRRLTEDDETHDDGLLSALVFKKISFAEALYEDARILRSLLHMVEIVAQAVLAQTGCASAST